MNITPELLLLPAPRQVEWSDGNCVLSAESVIWLSEMALTGSTERQALRRCALTLQETIGHETGLCLEIAAGRAWQAEPGVSVSLMLVPGCVKHPQGYTLSIQPGCINLAAETAAGIFYGVQTLRQLIEQCGATLPALRIRDWPDFSVRGVMLDISRDKVPTFETLLRLVERLAGWKINQLQLYTEHPFAYRRHPEVWAQASPMTGEEILALDAFCQERFIELVPNQNTFGHMGRWLNLPRYHDLAEAPDGCDTRWGHFDQPFSLNPSDPGSLELVRSLLDELLPHFSSRQVNVGCDETVDLGMGGGGTRTRSQEIVELRGVGRVYLDFLLKIYREVTARGHTMQYWGDIIMEHPELTPELPRDALALEWGYDAAHPFEAHGAMFAAAGVSFYVCPGTSSWNSIAGRTDNAVGNLRNAAINGLRHGAAGYLITDWGDNGHWQPLPASFLGLAYGSALAWCVEANQDIDIARALDIHVFQDAARVMGRLAYDLGNVYKLPGISSHNGSILFYLLQLTPQQLQVELGKYPDLEQVRAGFAGTEERIKAILAELPRAQMQAGDAQLLAEEFAWAGELLQHACRRVAWAIDLAQGLAKDDPGGLAALQAELEGEIQALMQRYTHIWHARNRPGGFRESVRRFEACVEGYEPDSRLQRSSGDV
jgi:hexosaminidase